MKRYFGYLTLLLLSMLANTACTEEEGTTPGSDSAPSVNLYQYVVGAEYNSDNDTKIRVVTNNQVDDVYYMAQKTEEFEASKLDGAALSDYVVKNGIKAEVLSVDSLSGGKIAEFVFTSLLGKYTIFAVGVKGDKKSVAKKVNFEGLIWNNLAEGTYVINAKASLQDWATSVLGSYNIPTTLQNLETDKTLYRFKDLYGKGNHLQIRLYPDYKATDNDGEYTFFRIPKQSTLLSYGSYGSVGVRDIGYWQDDDSFIFEGGYESGMYADYSCFIMLQYFVSAGNLGYGYDFFIPNK